MSESPSWLARDIRRARAGGEAALVRRQRERLADSVAHARAHSPYYRELYADLPERVEDPALLPVTDKRTLMSRFDDWATDRAVTYEDVRAFVDDPDLIGQRFLGEYLVATTSGTSGRRGFFLLEDRYMTVASALSSRALTSALGTGGVLRAVARRGRFAQLVATGGHYVGYAAYTQLVREGRWQTRLLRPFSVHTPMPELVAALNAYRPAVLIGYASTIMLLTAEQEAGRLRIAPLLVQPAGETMTADDTDRMARAFRATVRPVYGATECTYLSYGCSHGWYHVNSDWAVLEPVDADHRPTPPGELSHTVLLSNLANRIQPFLRYDLGDSVLLRPDPCPCGDPTPAVRVQGRAGDTLTLPTSGDGGDGNGDGDGGRVTLAPLALSTLFDRTPGVERFQIEQTAPSVLRVRMLLATDAEPDRVWHSVQHELARLLADNGARNVTLERAEEPPRQAPGGKYRTVVPLPDTPR
ncbi:phenylacetate--CoA ligase family protein [Streptomyces sp. NPDC054796]